MTRPDERNPPEGHFIFPTPRQWRWRTAAGSIPDALALYENHRKPRARRVVDESRDNRRLFHLPNEDALRAAFARRNMDRERSDLLYGYDPLTAELA